MAYDEGLAGVVLSNHGGRQLDFARSGIEVLVEVVQKLKEKRGLKFPNDKFQLFVDGGVRRATDVLKAIALGATAGAFFVSHQFFSYADGISLAWVQWELAGRSCMHSPLTAWTVWTRRCKSYTCVSRFFCQASCSSEIVQDEFEMNMRLLGANTIKDVVPEMVDASSIHSHIVAVPGDRLYEANCESNWRLLPHHGESDSGYHRREHAARSLEGAQGQAVSSTAISSGSPFVVSMGKYTSLYIAEGLCCARGCLSRFIPLTCMSTRPVTSYR